MPGKTKPRSVKAFEFISGAIDPETLKGSMWLVWVDKESAFHYCRVGYLGRRKRKSPSSQAKTKPTKPRPRPKHPQSGTRPARKSPKTPK